jgi:hypothetical protein
MDIYIEYIDNEPFYVSTTKITEHKFTINFTPTETFVYMVNSNFFNTLIDALNYSLLCIDENYLIHSLPFNEQEYDKDVFKLDVILMTPFKWLSNLIIDYRIYYGLNDALAFKDAYRVLEMSDFLHISLIKELLKKYPQHHEYFKEKLRQTNYLRGNKLPTLNNYINGLYPLTKN